MVCSQWRIKHNQQEEGKHVTLKSEQTWQLAIVLMSVPIRKWTDSLSETLNQFPETYRLL